METVGFIGIGTMGIRMAARLLQAGYPLRAYDVLPEALSNVEAPVSYTHLTLPTKPIV